MKLPQLGPTLSWGNTATMGSNSDPNARGVTGGLSILFCVLCIVDLFGVFPVITLPKSIISCGMYGIPLVVAVFGLQLYTAVLLGRSWLIAQEIEPHIKKKNRIPYAAVAELAFGDSARKMVTFLIDAAVFGSGLPNFIIAAQTLQIFWWKVTGGVVHVTYCIWMLLLGVLLCPVMWLGSPKDMKPIALSSVFIVSTVAITIWTCILMDDTSPLPIDNVVDLQPGTQEFLTAYGILAFQFDVHPMLLTLQVDMKNSKKINSAVLGGFSFTACLFVVTTVLAAYRYGTDISSNILQTIPPSLPLYLVALLVTVQLCLSSAVGNSALFLHIEDLLKIPREFCLKRCLLRSGILALGIFLAESVPRFDLVMGLVGSTLTGPLMFIFPPIFFVRLCYLKIKMLHRHSINTDKDVQNGGSLKQNGDMTPLITDAFETDYKTFSYENTFTLQDNGAYRIRWYDIILALIVSTLGLIATIIATYSSWSTSITYASYSPPCLVNSTAAARNFLKSYLFIA